MKRAEDGEGYTKQTEREISLKTAGDGNEGEIKRRHKTETEP